MLGNIDPIYLLLFLFVAIIAIIGYIVWQMRGLRMDIGSMAKNIATIRRTTTGSMQILPINPVDPQKMSNIEELTKRLRETDTHNTRQVLQLASQLAHLTGKLQDELEDGYHGETVSLTQPPPAQFSLGGQKYMEQNYRG